MHVRTGPARRPQPDAARPISCDHARMDKPNRAERRRNKFGGGRATEHGGWPTVQPNPVFEVDAETPAAAEPAQEAKPMVSKSSSKKARSTDAAKN